MTVFQLHEGSALDAYSNWDTPKTIMSDGAYGVNGFPGDPKTPLGLGEWYRPHIEAWSAAAKPATALWFWNTEIGWANTHSVLEENGWVYEQVVTWDKGMSHVAGNVNGQTMRRFPVVTEICVLYSRKLEFVTPTDVLSAQDWLRSEWKRSGLPMRLANEACEVKNAASRKYLAADDVWYLPPPEAMVMMSKYANQYGIETDRPYFSLDGVNEVTAAEWAEMRYIWNFEHGLTNVWAENSLHSSERLRDGKKAAHLNQKPTALMRRLIEATTNPGDVVWEPFGGTGTGSVAALETGRKAFLAESNPKYAHICRERLLAAT